VASKSGLDYFFELSLSFVWK